MPRDTSAAARAILLLSALALASCREQAPAPAEVSPDPKVRDRQELVLQPRRGWAPGEAARRLELKLIAEKSRIRLGEGFGYRLELRNTGREPFVFKEAPPSFMKEGGFCGERWRFYAKPPRGKEARLTCEAQGTAAPRDSGLDLALAPGEYVITRPARAFRRLKTSAVFQETGVYRVRVEFVDAKARTKSAPVELEVVP